jgi:outer membrane protein OmpA-like peptidoglycan-associated protein
MLNNASFIALFAGLTLSAGALAQVNPPSDCQQPRGDWSTAQLSECLDPDKPLPRGVHAGPLSKGAGVGAAAAVTAAPVAVAMQIQFDLNSAELRPGSTQLLSNLAEALKSAKLAGQPFVLTGHTDVTGTPELNMRLSQQRAERVRDFLVSRGVEVARLSAVGKGQNELLPNTPPSSELHRRVVIALKR